MRINFMSYALSKLLVPIHRVNLTGQPRTMHNAMLEDRICGGSVFLLGL